MTDSVFGLEVYKRSAALANAVHGAVRSWDSLDQWSSGIQMLRCADSVGANIAEGAGRWSHADQVRFLFMARASALELQHWLAFAEARNLRHPPDGLTEAQRIGRMLNGLIRALKSEA